MVDRVNAETIREIIETVVDAVDARRTREAGSTSQQVNTWSGSIANVLSVVCSFGVGIYMLAVLVGDVASAKSDADNALTTVQRLQLEQVEMRKDIQFLVEAEKRRSGIQ